MARVDVVMPKMGESVMEGTVLEWKKAVGEPVEQDETLLEISTDKVDSEVPSPSAGVLAEILVPEGETVDVGSPIAVIETEVTEGAGDAPANSPQDSAEPASDSASEAEGAQENGEPAAKPAAPNIRPRDEAAHGAEENGASQGATGGTTVEGATVEVVMPKMGESVMEGTVLEWKKAVGEPVEQDETLLEISTDKVDSEVPSPSAGVLAEILVPEGETVDVGSPIALIATGEPIAAAPDVSPTAETSAGAGSRPGGNGSATPAPSDKSYGMTGPAIEGDGATHAASVETASAGGAIPRRSESGRFYSPLVRAIAEKEGLGLSELETLQGSGAEGRVTKADVMTYLDRRTAPAAPRPTAQPAARQAPAPQPTVPAASQSATQGETPHGVEVVEMDRMRQLISEHMTRSKSTSAHVTSFTEVDMTGVVRHRENHKQAFGEREGVKLTYTPYFMLAAIEPLREHPLMNSSVDGKRILIKKQFHVGIAVAIGKKGLLVPIVRNAGQQNLTGLAHTVSDLAERARTKQLMPDELQGGTFTITNVGSLGSLMGTPIINQPQVAILSPGAIVKRPVVVEDPELGDVIAIRHMMYVSLSYDHRIIDGAMAASFLRAYRERLEGIDAQSELF